MAIAISLAQYLEDRDIAYDVLTHIPTPTASRTAEACHVSGEQLAKSVIVKDGTQFMLAAVPACRHVRLGILSRLLRRRVGLATEAEASALFADCDTGAFPALGDAYGLKMIVDDSLLRENSDTYLEGGDHSTLVHLGPGVFATLTEGATLGRFTAHD